MKRYALETPVDQFGTSDTGFATNKFLLACRLIEAGVRCVSLTLADYDTHSGNFARMRRLLPVLDKGLDALVNDLQDRGMLDDVTIVVWGEFGRTPKINKNAGRDHWPGVGPRHPRRQRPASWPGSGQNGQNGERRYRAARSTIRT